MRDISGRELHENDQVTLLHVTETMVSGLPGNEVEFLRSMSGKTVVISAVDDTSVEVTMTDPGSGMIHFLRVSGEDVAFWASGPENDRWNFSTNLS